MARTIDNALAIVDVGHGASAVLFVEDQVVVLDAGPKGGLLEFLHDQDVTRVSCVILSHADADHVGGLTQLLASPEMIVDRILVNPDSSKATVAWEHLAYEVDQARKKGELRADYSVKEGDTITVGDFVRLEVLAPNGYLALKGVGGVDGSERRIKSNSLSVVVRVIHHGKPIALLPGDLDHVGLSNVADDTPLQAPVLAFPHHGGLPSTRKPEVGAFVERLCQAAQPDIVVFSTGWKRHAMPNAEVVAHLRRCVPEARILCTQISEHCAAELPNEGPTHLVSAFSLGRCDHRCCAGTVVIPLDSAEVAEGFLAGHEEFVGNSAATALCKLRVDDGES